MAKCQTKSEQCRNEGNMEFLHRHLQEALSYYGQSIVYAPRGSVELCLAFSNRSAVLFELNCFEECLRDIERALSLSACPNNVQTKVDRRKQKCLSVRNTKLTPAKKRPNPEPTLKDINLKLPACSNSCKLQYRENEGRILVATTDIQPGDVLMVENPYAFVILPHCVDEFCHHCIHLLPYDFVPCEFCSEVKFCSESCRQVAMSSYHCLECGYLKILYDSGLAHLALRIISFTEFEVLADLLCSHNNSNSSSSSSNRISWQNREGVFGLNVDEIYDKSYSSVYNLMSNAGHILPDDLEVYKAASRCLVSFMEDTKYISTFVESLQSMGTICNECKTIAAAKTFLQNVILKHIQQLICNAHAVTVTSGQASTDLSEQFVDIVAVSERKIASGVYPTVSLMNHSCDPNTFSSFIGKTLVVRATKEIKVGEEIFNCYGPRFGRMPKEIRRQSLLQQYYFLCQCFSCTSAEEIEKETLLTALTCQSCGAVLKMFETEKWIACGSCLKKFDSSELMNYVRSIEEKFFDNIRIGDLKGIENNLQDLNRFLYKRNKRLVELFDEAVRVFTEYGEFQKASSLLITNIENNQFIYGDNSIEVANEILKLTDFIKADVNRSIDANLRKNIVKLAEKAVQIFSIHYGSDCLQIEEIASSITPTNPASADYAPLKN